MRIVGSRVDTPVLAAGGIAGVLDIAKVDVRFPGFRLSVGARSFKITMTGVAFGVAVRSFAATCLIEIADVHGGTVALRPPETGGLRMWCSGCP